MVAFIDLARALACPARVHVLELLGNEALSLSRLARHAGIAPSTAHEHLAVLVRMGLVERVRRGPSHLYVRSRTRCYIALETVPEAQVGSDRASERPVAHPTHV